MIIPLYFYNIIAHTLVVTTRRVVSKPGVRCGNNFDEPEKNKRENQSFKRDDAPHRLYGKFMQLFYYYSKNRKLKNA